MVSTPASCRMRRQPCSTIGWSSMMRTLAMGIRSAFLARQRNDDAHARAAAGCSLDRAVPAEGAPALLHAAQPEPGGLSGVDPAAVVFDGALDLHRRCVSARRLVEIDADVVRLRMPDRVGQAF